ELALEHRRDGAGGAAEEVGGGELRLLGRVLRGGGTAYAGAGELLRRHRAVDVAEVAAGARDAAGRDVAGGVGAVALVDVALAGEGAVVDVERDGLVEAAVARVELRVTLVREVVDEADARGDVVEDVDRRGAVGALDLLALPAQTGVDRQAG